MIQKAVLWDSYLSSRNLLRSLAAKISKQHKFDDVHASITDSVFEIQEWNTPSCWVTSL